ncbi:DUF3105 domain-containing protein [Nocardioides sp. C4-1]|uniref:DUF3105 domain-containing protein n=1 Tax=Nocardioides sp. C4-1 TaxID=3151851 RepID=UPI0032637048
MPLVLGLLAALVMVAAAITIPLVLTRDDDDERGARQEPSPTATDGPSGEESGDLSDPSDPSDPQPGAELAGVEVYDDLPTTHVDEQVDYEQTPPVGGEHYGRWLDCGVYDRPVPDVVAVHDLEHGTVWITYDADSLSDDDVDALADVLPQNGILSPYVGLDAPVVVTVWGRQLALSGADDPLLQVFIDEYEGGVTAPEPLASCAGGLSLSQAESLTGTLSS